MFIYYEATKQKTMQIYMFGIRNISIMPRG